MGKITNKWVGYLHRTYQQIKDNAITQMAIEVPEITDHTESNPYIKELSIWAGMTEHLNYYIDNAAREAFLTTARQYPSLVKIAKFANYRLRGVKAANVDLTFTLSQAIATNYEIPAGTIISTDNDIQFVTSITNYIPAGRTAVVIPAKQMVLVSETNIGITSGQPNQKVVLTDDTEDKSVSISIAGVSYMFTPNLLNHSSTDKVFTTSLNTDGLMEVTFGDGIFGALPPAGQVILASYGVSKGEAGNLAEGSITKLISDLENINPVTISVSNFNRSSGGADIESIEELRVNIPKYNRTQQRAVTYQDYKDIAELNSGVRSAGVVFKCGKTVDVYVLPKGGGVASQELLDSVKEDFYDETRMVTTQVRVLPAGEIQLTIEWDIQVLPAFSKLAVEEAVRKALNTYVNDTNLSIGGAIEIGNIYEVIEGVTGVDYSKSVVMIIKPYARITNGNSTLNWSVTAKPSQETDIWNIVYSKTGYLEVTKNGIYAGTYEIGQDVDFPEVTFRVATSSYQAGDSWEFVTYPYNGSIHLKEPSVITLDNRNLKLNMNGGV